MPLSHSPILQKGNGNPINRILRLINSKIIP
jgi:hypothetical protein